SIGAPSTRSCGASRMRPERRSKSPRGSDTILWKNTHFPDLTPPRPPLAIDAPALENRRQRFMRGWVLAAAWLMVAGSAAVEPRPTTQSLQGPGTGLIVGQVVDGTTGRPIAGAIVTTGSTLPGTPPGQFRLGAQRVLTTAEGRFLIRDL